MSRAMNNINDNDVHTNNIDNIVDYMINNNVNNVGNSNNSVELDLDDYLQEYKDRLNKHNNLVYKYEFNNINDPHINSNVPQTSIDIVGNNTDNNITNVNNNNNNNNTNEIDNKRRLPVLLPTTRLNYTTNSANNDQNTIVSNDNISDKSVHLQHNINNYNTHKSIPQTISDIGQKNSLRNRINIDLHIMPGHTNNDDESIKSARIDGIPVNNKNTRRESLKLSSLIIADSIAPFRLSDLASVSSLYRYQVASYLLAQARKNQYNINYLNLLFYPSKLQLTLFLYAPTGIIYVLRHLFLICLLLLTFFELPNWCQTRTNINIDPLLWENFVSNSANNFNYLCFTNPSNMHTPNYILNSNSFKLHPLLSGLIELSLLIALFITEILLPAIAQPKSKYKSKKGRLLPSSARFLLPFLLLSIIDCIIYINLPPQYRYFRVGPLLRSTLPIAMILSVRRVFQNVVRALPNILEIFVLVFILLMMFAYLGVILFSASSNIDVYHNTQTIEYNNVLLQGSLVNITSTQFLVFPTSAYFVDFSEALFSLQVLLTTNNFPDILVTAFHTNKWVFFYFFVFILIGLYFLYPLLLASIFSTFRDRATTHQQSLEYRKKLAFSAIFTLLDIENKNYLTQNNILLFTDCYFDQQNHFKKISKQLKKLFKCKTKPDNTNNNTTTHKNGENFDYVSKTIGGTDSMITSTNHQIQLAKLSFKNRKQSQLMLSTFTRRNSEPQEDNVPTTDNTNNDVLLTRDAFPEFCNVLQNAKQQQFIHSINNKNSNTAVPTNNNKAEDKSDSGRCGYCCGYKLCSKLDIIVNHTYFDRCIDVLLGCNLILLLYQSVVNGGDTISSSRAVDISSFDPFELIQFVLTILFMMEILLKSFFYHQFWSSWRNILDALLTIASFIAEILLILNISQTTQLRYILLFRSFRLLRLLARFTGFRMIFGTLIQLLHRFAILGVLIACCYYLFSSVGMLIFGGLLSMDNPALTNSPYSNSSYWAMNFNDFISSIWALFSLMLVNNSAIITNAIVLATGSRWSRLYFILFYYINVIIILNLVIATILDEFLTQWKTIKDVQKLQKKAAKHNKTLKTNNRNKNNNPSNNSQNIGIDEAKNNANKINNITGYGTVSANPFVTALSSLRESKSEFSDEPNSPQSQKNNNNHNEHDDQENNNNNNTINSNNNINFMSPAVIGTNSDNDSIDWSYTGTSISKDYQPKSRNPRLSVV
jgi:hypothetical protein